MHTLINVFIQFPNNWIHCDVSGVNLIRLQTPQRISGIQGITLREHINHFGLLTPKLRWNNGDQNWLNTSPDNLGAISYNDLVSYGST